MPPSLYAIAPILLMAFSLFSASGHAHSTELTPSCQFNKTVRNKTLYFDLHHSQVPGTLATTEHQFRVNNKTFSIQATSTAKGLLAILYSGQLNQRSEGQIVNKQGLRPTYYYEKRGKKPARETVVDLQTETITFKKNNQTASWLKGSQDRLSMIYQLASVLNCHPGPKDGLVLEIPVMTTGRLEIERFTLSKAQPIEIKKLKETQPAVLLTNQPVQGDDVIRLWFAPNKEFLPLQIQVEDHKQKKITQTLVNYQIR